MKKIHYLFMAAGLLLMSCRSSDFWPWNHRDFKIFTDRISADSVSAIHAGEEWLIAITALDSTDGSGILLLSRSRDIQGPWSKPRQIAKTVRACRFPRIRQFRDGKIWIQCEIGRMSSNGVWNSDGCIFVHSYDYGASFSVPRDITIQDLKRWMPMDCVIETEKNILILPVFNRSEEKLNRPGIIFSENEGETWSKWIPMFPKDNTLKVESASFIVLNDGRILGLIKETHSDLLLNTCSDTIGFWSEPRIVNIYGSKPVLLMSSSGEIICCYRDLWPVGISMMSSYDFGTTFEEEVILNSDSTGSLLPVEYEKGNMVYFICGEDGIIAGIRCIRKHAVPTGLSLSVMKDHSVNLRWNSVKQAKYYRIYRATGADTSVTGQVIAEIIGNSQCRDTSVVPGENYGYRITSVSGSGKIYPGSGNESAVSRSQWIQIPLDSLKIK